MKRVVFNQKGGVGKSTIAVNLAAIFAQQGRRTLIIDMDPQCNASRYLLGDAAKTVTPTLADFFKNTLEFQFYPTPTTAYVQPTPFERLSLIASNPDIGELQGKLESRFKIYKLRDALRELEGTHFDDIIIDTPPAYNFFTQSALIAADRCLIPFDGDDFARQALYTLMRNVAELKSDHNNALMIEGIVFNQYQAGTNLHQRLRDELTAEGLPVLESKLSRSVRVSESHDRCLPLIYLDSRHKVTQEYLALCQELDA